MSYNTRRNIGNTPPQGYPMMNTRQRGGLQQNYIPGGQYQNPNSPHQKSPVQMNNLTQLPQRPSQHLQNLGRPQNQGYPAPNFINQNYQQNQPEPLLVPQLRQPHSAIMPQQTPLKSALKKEVKTENSPQQSPIVSNRPIIQQDVQKQIPPPIQQQQLPVELPEIQVSEPNSAGEENGDIKKKTLFFKGKGKISKKEKRGRRNKRIRKMIMPKNALMILNELAAGHRFVFIEKDPNVQNAASFVDQDTYVAAVTIDGIEHIGYGKSKITAKNAAAETALRHIVLTKIANSKQIQGNNSAQNSDSECDTKSGDGKDMEASEQGEDEVSWVHVASFAMHKLFSHWLSDTEEKQLGSQETNILARAGVPDLAIHIKDPKLMTRSKSRKPAKQLPENPQSLNPVMLLNQMRDDVTYDEVNKEGNPPNIIFTLKSIIDGHEFFGRGSNKKIARRNCAFAACTKLYDLSYPIEEYDPSNSAIKPLDQPSVDN